MHSEHETFNMNDRPHQWIVKTFDFVAGGRTFEHSAVIFVGDATRKNAGPFNDTIYHYNKQVLYFITMTSIKERL